MSETRVGISGWRYSPWRGIFYPKELPAKSELGFVSRVLNSVEINGTFYSLQRSKSFRNWFEAVPDDFLFAVKAPRFITHMKKLRHVRVPLANFFASGLLALTHKLGPILWQLPPQFRFNAATLRQFISALPHSRNGAGAIARRHDSHLKGRAVLTSAEDGPLRHALEVCHPSFVCEEFFDLLTQHNICAVIADNAGKWPLIKRVTADFLYLRLHGAEELYSSGYPQAALREWKREIIRLRIAGLKRVKRPRDVFVYFDNDAKVQAPFDAHRFSVLLGIRNLAWEVLGLPQLPNKDALG